MKTGKYEIEKYLSLKSYENRRALSKLRIRSHNLLVETGKWYNIEINQRICKQCDQYKIEDEFHLIFECPKYSELRINAFSTIEKNEDINLAHDSNVEDLQYLFSQASLYLQHSSNLRLSLGKTIILISRLSVLYRLFIVYKSQIWV